MNLKLRKEPKNAPSFHTVMEEDFGVALELIVWLPTFKKGFVEL
jgi:hypothetical protein